MYSLKIFNYQKYQKKLFLMVFCSLASIAITLVVFLVFFYLLARYFNGPRTPLAHSMEGKTVIITGGDSSIGFETSKELLEKALGLSLPVAMKKRQQRKSNQLQTQK